MNILWFSQSFGLRLHLICSLFVRNMWADIEKMLVVNADAQVAITDLSSIITSLDLYINVKQLSIEL